MISGLLAFPLTPFDSDDRVDCDVLARHLEAQFEARRPVGPDSSANPSTWFAACGTGELSALSLPEYRDVMRTAVDVIGGRGLVFGGAGGGPRTAQAHAAIAQECGADGLLLLPPYLVSSTTAGLVDHIRYVASSTALPVIVYQRGTAVLDPQATLALLEIPGVIGVKDGIGDLDTMSRIIATVRTSGHARAAEFAFFNGLPTAELSAPAYSALGVHSYSSAVLAFAPDIAVAYYAALVAGDTGVRDALLTRFYLPLTALRQEVPGYAVALVKAGAELSGLPVGPVRPPLVGPTTEHLDRLAAILDDGRAVLADLPHATGAA